MWTATATIGVASHTKDSTGAAVVSYTDTENVPCSIQAAGGSESNRVGAGYAAEDRKLFTGFFPTRKADGTALAIPASSRVTSGGVVYRAFGAGSEYADGIQTVPLGVVS